MPAPPPLEDALVICRLLLEQGPDRYERAAVRWIGRLLVDQPGVSLRQDDLARSFHVISYDRRGHGGSEDCPEPGSRRDDEDDLAGLMEALDLGPAHVVGNSFGASIALGLGARRPELFRALCAHEPPLMSLAADDPIVAEVGERVTSVVEQIERGQAEAAARDFVENIALGPGAWEMMPEEDRAAMIGLADTFAAEQRDPAGRTSTSIP